MRYVTPFVNGDPDLGYGVTASYDQTIDELGPAIADGSNALALGTWTQRGGPICVMGITTLSGIDGLSRRVTALSVDDRRTERTPQITLDFLTGNVGIGTTSPIAKLDVNGDIALSGSNRYLNFGAATGTDGYGLRDNAGTIEIKNNSGSWASIGGGTVASGTTGYIPYYSGYGSTLTATSSLFISVGWQYRHRDDIPEQQA